MSFTEVVGDVPVIHEVVRAPLKQVTLNGTKYFVAPTDPAPVPPVDEAAAIAQRLAAAVKIGQERARQERLATPVKFDIPIEGTEN